MVMKIRGQEIIIRFIKDYKFLSNFYPSPVEYEGIIYPTVENAYQASKFPTEYRKYFVDIKPFKAKKLSRENMFPMRSEFEKEKIKIMKELVFQKFFNDKLLKEKLLETGDRLIAEGNTWKDTFWGVDLHKPCKDCLFGFEGENNLGIILMEVRDILK